MENYLDEFLKRTQMLGLPQMGIPGGYSSISSGYSAGKGMIGPLSPSIDYIAVKGSYESGRSNTAYSLPGLISKASGSLYQPSSGYISASKSPGTGLTLSSGGSSGAKSSSSGKGSAGSSSASSSSSSSCSGSCGK